MNSETCDAIAARFADFERVVEVGIGHRTDVARTLIERDVAVTATDVHPREVPPGVRFRADDVADPDPAVYADADALYGLNLPPELHRPAFEVARDHDLVFAFTTLGGDGPAVSVRRETVPGETLFWARE